MPNGQFAHRICCESRAESEHCAFGAEWNDLENSATFKEESVTRIDPNTALTDLQTTQVIAAANPSDQWVDAEALEQAWDIFDDNYAYYVELKDRFTGETYQYVSYWAGDTPVGSIFRAGTTTRVAVMNDNDFSECVVREPVGRWDGIALSVASLPPELQDVAALRNIQIKGLESGVALPASARARLLAEADEMANNGCYLNREAWEDSNTILYSGEVFSKYGILYYDDLTYSLPEEDELAFLTYLDAIGPDSFDIYESLEIATSCGDAGEGQFFAIHSRSDQTLLVLSLHDQTT